MAFEGSGTEFNMSGDSNIVFLGSGLKLLPPSKLADSKLSILLSTLPLYMNHLLQCHAHPEGWVTVFVLHQIKPTAFMWMWMCG